MSLWFQDIRRAFNVMKEVAVDLERANQFEKVFTFFFFFFFEQLSSVWLIRTC